jgi:hypothetical protein
MGFNKRKMEDQRRQAAETEAAIRRATDAQVLEDAERLIARRDDGRGCEDRSRLWCGTPGSVATETNSLL